MMMQNSINIAPHIESIVNPLSQPLTLYQHSDMPSFPLPPFGAKLTSISPSRDLTVYIPCETQFVIGHDQGQCHMALDNPGISEYNQISIAEQLADR